MSIIGRDANKNKKCFAACQPGTYCECLGKTIEEKDCGFSDISCLLQHMSSVAKSEELVGNLQIAGDIECWVDQIRQLNTTTRPPVAGLAEWLPIADAPKDGTPVLLKFKDPLAKYNCDRGFDGLQFVGNNRNDAMQWGFAAPVGMGGFPDEWLEGWKPLDNAQGHDMGVV